MAKATAKAKTKSPKKTKPTKKGGTKKKKVPKKKITKVKTELASQDDKEFQSLKELEKEVLDSSFEDLSGDEEVEETPAEVEDDEDAGYF